MSATWGDLFERADEYDVSEGDVRRAVAERREEGAGAREDGGDRSPVDGAEGDDDPTNDAAEGDDDPTNDAAEGDDDPTNDAAEDDDPPLDADG